MSVLVQFLCAALTINIAWCDGRMDAMAHPTLGTGECRWQKAVRRLGDDIHRYGCFFNVQHAEFYMAIGEWIRQMCQDGRPDKFLSRARCYITDTEKVECAANTLLQIRRTHNTEGHHEPLQIEYKTPKRVGQNFDEWIKSGRHSWLECTARLRGLWGEIRPSRAYEEMYAANTTSVMNLFDKIDTEISQFLARHPSGGP